MAQQQFPQKFGKYILTRKLAMGGMAEIFRAKTVGAEGFEKEIVIKRILPHYTEDDDFVKMFIDEANVASKLQHANIVQIFDFNVQDGSYYIAMEYVEGKDLKKVVETGIKRGNPLTPAQCVWIIMELAKGLHYAHVKTHKGKPLNIVHRDISPQNGMISFTGEVKLMDFGIAKAASRSTKTVAGTVKGKCAYMSPEQARGKPLDGRSDLFALAVVLWEMLTHKRLFLGDSDFVTLSNVLKQEAPPPSSINPDVPAALDTIVLKALSKDRDERQKDVEAFHRELTRWFYSSVTDLDAEALGPWMKSMFSEDITELQNQAAQERTMALSLDDVANVAPPAAGQATVALPLGDGQDPQAAKTVLDDDSLTAEKVRQALAQAASAGDADAATRALPAADAQHLATGAVPSQGGTGVAPAKKGRGWIWAVLVLLLAGGGGAAYYFLGMAKGTGKTTARGTEVATAGPAGTKAAGTAEADDFAALTLSWEPADAKVQFTVNGAPIDGHVARDLDLGKKVKLEADAKGFEHFEKILKITDKTQSFQVALKPKAAAAEVLPLVINPSDPKATVIVDGKVMGQGDQTVKGPAGKRVKVQIKPSDGSPTIEKVATISLKSSLLKVDVPGAAVPSAPSLATVQVTCLPAGSQVTANVGTVETTAAGSVVKGLIIGQAVKVTCKRSGYATASQQVVVGEQQSTVSMTLKKRAHAEPRGNGTIRVNARPWAKCSVGGKAPKTTPFSLVVPAGRTRIRCTRGGVKKSKSVTVKPNATKAVVLDMTGQ